jgi:tRNA (guanine-N7-)-methyltransferase
MQLARAMGPLMTTRVRGGGPVQVDPRFVVDMERLAVDGWAGAFGRQAPLAVEIGFGNGQSLAAMAASRPEVNFLGIEMFGQGIEKLSKRLAREGIKNVRLIRGDGVGLLSEIFAPGSIDEMHVNFPDPWPKRRHHKRRMVAPPFVEVLFSQVRPDGLVYLATDFTCYAFQMRTVFEAHPGFANLAGPHRFGYHQPGRARTKYERKFAAQGSTIRYLRYRRSGS